LISAISIIPITLLTIAMIFWPQYSKVELALFDKGFKILFVQSKIYPNETADLRPKLFNLECGDTAYWTPYNERENDVYFKLSDDCNKNNHQEIKNVICSLYSEDICFWANSHFGETNTKIFNGFILDTRIVPDGRNKTGIWIKQNEFYGDKK
jgi:hypothetical protein